jgi:hypothetical protein
VTRGAGGKAALKREREKWTLSFDARLKAFLVRAARRRGVYPVTLLEELVREKFNPYGHTGVKDSVEYVRMLRRCSRNRSDAAFLREIRAWQRSGSS